MDKTGATRGGRTPRVHPEFAHTGGHYLDDGQEAYTGEHDANLVDHPHGVEQWALDPEVAERLWLLSADLVTPRA